MTKKDGKDISLNPFFLHFINKSSSMHGYLRLTMHVWDILVNVSGYCTCQFDRTRPETRKLQQVCFRFVALLWLSKLTSGSVHIACSGLMILTSLLEVVNRLDAS